MVTMTAKCQYDSISGEGMAFAGGLRGLGALGLDAGQTGGGGFVIRALVDEVAEKAFFRMDRRRASARVTERCARPQSLRRRMRRSWLPLSRLRSVASLLEGVFWSASCTSAFTRHALVTGPPGHRVAVMHDLDARHEHIDRSRYLIPLVCNVSSPSQTCPAHS